MSQSCSNKSSFHSSIDNSSCDSEQGSEKDKIPPRESVNGEDQYIPIPYIFTLKDIFDQPITLQPELSENCKIQCPPFYILLDHTIAVLWAVFSGENTQILQTAHIHWALKFLEGLKDKQNKQTDDVKMAITYLQDILIDMISNLDICELEKRHEQTIADNSGNCCYNKTPNYCDFEAYLKPERCRAKGGSDVLNKGEKCECRESTKIIDGQKQQQQQEDESEEFHSALDDNPPQSVNDKCTKLFENKEYPSFILQEMLGRKNPEKLKDIVNNTTYYGESSIDKEEPIKLDDLPLDKISQIPAEILDWRENQYSKIIRQLQQMRQLDEGFKNMNCSTSSDIIKKLEDFINQPDPHC